MSLNLILASLAGGAVSMPAGINVTRNDGGTPVEFILNSDGYRYQRTGSSLTQVAPWVFGAPTSTYEVRSTLAVGSFTTDPSAGTWLSLGTTRLWDRGAAASASQTVGATIEIRNAATLQIVSTTGLTITCDRS